MCRGAVEQSTSVKYGDLLCTEAKIRLGLWLAFFLVLTSHLASNARLLFYFLELSRRRVKLEAGSGGGSEAMVWGSVGAGRAGRGQ